MAASGPAPARESVNPLPNRPKPKPQLMPALALIKMGLSFVGRCLSVGIGIAAVLCFAGAVGGMFYGTFFGSLLSGSFYQPMVAWVASKLPTLLTPLAPFFPLLPFSLAFAHYSYQRLVSTRFGGNREAHAGQGGFSVPWLGLLGVVSVVVPGGLFINSVVQGASLGASLYSLALTSGAFGVALGLGREYVQYKAQKEEEQRAIERKKASLQQQAAEQSKHSDSPSSNPANIVDDVLDASHPRLTMAQQMQARDLRNARQQEVERQTNGLEHNIESPTKP